MLDGADPNAIVVFGSVVLIVLISIVGSIISTWVKRNSKSLASDAEFLAALKDFKEKTDKRLSNLEAIVTNDSLQGTRESQKSISEKKSSTIDVELTNEPEKTAGKSARLRNMLNE